VTGYTEYHSKYWAYSLTLKGASGELESLSRSISNSRVDLNPHQVDAALFAIRSPLSNGVLLADEVGLGKTIEAGIVLAQRWAERKRRILLILPASLRKQWQQELESKFFLSTLILDSKIYNDYIRSGQNNPFVKTDKIVICSYHFASSKKSDIKSIPWDIVVIDEAHRLRNVYKTSNRIAKDIRDALGSSPKMLLTATPLQNSLMELYGLVSVIDRHVFGDPTSYRYQFIQTTNEKLRNAMLRERIKPLCCRTLRKQVVEYVPFTKRALVTQDFSPSDAEHNLYELISEYLQRESLIALPASQRTLITMVLRKLLASSSFAITKTLQSLIDRLNHLSEEMQLFDDEDLEGISEYEDELQEQQEQLETDDSEHTEISLKNPYIDPDQLKQELIELRRYARLAEQITSNSKGEALPLALKTAFEKAEKIGAARKAVVFTESRRTQQYLFDLLSTKGYEGKLAMINGSNNDPTSKGIYNDWLKRHEGQDIITGSKAIDIKAAIVEHFQHNDEILIATEAAAEGVNLQFCSLVVNYDLPWNPQRIEQRIGRCHRYGQKHDVVVVNFINQRNAADRRVHELLREKFRLFDGVFGASDEVLGALESGIDIERRIAEVYQRCRTTEEIESAFDALQSELEEKIQSRLAETRKVLLENMDEEVVSRLRVFQNKTLESLSQRQRWLLDLTRTELNGQARFDTEQPRFHYSGPVAHHGYYHLDWKKAEEYGDIFYRQDHPLAQSVIQQALERRLEHQEVVFDYSNYGSKISALETFIGSSGWLNLHRLTVESFDVEEFLVFAAQTDDGRVLDQELCSKLMLLPASIQGKADKCHDLQNVLQQEVDKKVQEVDVRNGKFFEEEVLKLDRWSEDLKKGMEQEIKELDKQLRQVKNESKLAASLSDKLKAQKQIKSLEQTRNQKRKDLFTQQDKIDTNRDQLIEKIEQQLKQKKDIQGIFQIRWSIV